FVQKKNFRFVNQCATKSQFLLHSARKLVGFPVFERFNLYVNVLDQIVVFLNSGIENTRKKLQIFFYSKVWIQRKFPGHISQYFSNFLKVFPHIPTFDDSRTAVWKDYSGQHSENGGFTGTIGTNEPENFSGIHFKTHIIYCNNFFFFLAVGFSEMMDFDAFHFYVSVFRLLFSIKI